MARILLVEDEDGIRSMLAEVFSDAGYEVVEAESGDAGAILVDRAGDFDVLVTDINMPGKLSGLDLGRHFRARYAECPIVYITGQRDVVRGLPVRPDREIVLFKPFGLAVLTGTVRSMLAAAAKSSNGGRTDRAAAAATSGAETRSEPW